MTEADNQSSQSNSDANNAPIHVWLILFVVALLPWVAFALAPASLNWSPFYSGSNHYDVHDRAALLLDICCVLILVISLIGTFGVVFTREFFVPGRTSSLTVIEAIGVIACGLVAVVGCFATLYTQISSEHHDCFVITSDHRHVLRHAEAVYFTITTFTTTGFGDITATSKVCRLVVSGQTLVGVAILTVLIAGLASRIIDHSRN